MRRPAEAPHKPAPIRKERSIQFAEIPPGQVPEAADFLGGLERLEIRPRSGELTIDVAYDLLFQDTSLYACALEHQRIYDLTLVTAPDIDWQADGFQRDGIATRAAVDRKLRSVLQGSAIPYAVICGTGEARTQSALDAIAHWQRTPRPRNTHDTEWKWSCDTCSDPQCEHRLFSRLLGSS